MTVRSILITLLDAVTTAFRKLACHKESVRVGKIDTQQSAYLRHGR